MFIQCTLDNDWNIHSIYSSDTAYLSPSSIQENITGLMRSMNTFIHYIHVCCFHGNTGYFLKHSQNTQMLCYAKQYCFPNKLCFMTKLAEQALDRVSLSESNEPWSLFLSPVHAVSSTGPLKTQPVSFDTTNTTNTADPNPQPLTRDLG